VIVSHDRTFLDNVITKTVDVTQEQLVTYEGNYTYYLQEKEMREEIQQGAFENQQAKIRQTERFIERFRAKATKSKQVQSRVKALDRMDLVEEVVSDNAAVNFRFTFKQPSGRQVVTLKDVSKAYGPLDILKSTNAMVERGDKIALIGANGKGKSTLLRIIANDEPVQGERTIGYNVIYGFYAQHQLESLHVDSEILDELKHAGSGKTEQELRNVLGCFLFSDEDVFKKIKVLSGGEKSRVALAKTLISEANFLLLDEPTNHLDFISENILIQALQQYQGSFVVVSHNRHFVSQVANKIWYIENHEIKEYLGTYDEYEYWRKKKEAAAIPPPPAPKKQELKPQPKPQPSTSNPNAKKISDLNRELKKVEDSIHTIQQEKEKIEVEMAKPEVFGNFEKINEVQQQYEKIDFKLEEENKKWESIALEVEELEK
jgi:ATP-binding cassette, subfamily F, member 3